MIKIETKKVKDIMSRNVISINTGATVSKAIKILKNKHISGAPVLDDEKNLVGMVSESDILKLVEYHPFLTPFLELLEDQPDDLKDSYQMASQKKISEIMSKHLITVHPDTEVAHAAAIMVEKNINRLPVVKEKNERIVIGIITRADILKAF